MDKITLNGAIALLEECLVNGDGGPFRLYAWFCEERDLIDRTIRDVSQQSRPVDVVNEK